MRACSAKLVLNHTGNVPTGPRFEFARQPKLQGLGFAEVFVDEVGPRTGIFPPRSGSTSASMCNRAPRDGGHVRQAGSRRPRSKSRREVMVEG
jgi:hypothetical protein